ncbi:MAG: SDR family oxidoreductase [Acidobacteria bacterium]|nr:SDR family oxidoreductase [Acidobacteriota bacterium]
MRFDGKTVVVTGGALGIGRAVCELLAERGAAVAIVDRDERAAREVGAHIESNGGKAVVHALDVSNFDEVKTAVDTTHAAFGSVDSLVVSAGIQRYGTALTTDDAEWDEVLNVNLRGAWNAAKAVIPFIQRSGGGTIVNVSSVQALASQQNVLAYTVSKHALIGLTRSIAMDFAKDGIRANALCPGTVDTPMLRWAASLDPDPQSVYDACSAMHPLGRIAQPREIAEVVAFLAHESSSFVTGSVWTADGGLLTQIGGVPKTE